MTTEQHPNRQTLPEKTIHVPHIEPHWPDGEWTQQAATKLLFHSFRHSQGSPVLQEWFFEYVRSVSGQLLLPKDWKTPVKRRLRQAITTYLDFSEKQDSAAPYHKRVPYDLLTRETNRVYDRLAQAVTRPVSIHPHSQIRFMITVDILQRENEYLLERNGRPRAEDLPEGEPVHALSFFSFIQHYALERHPTGLTVFDQMYQEVADLIQTSRQAQQNPSPKPLDPWLLSADELELLHELLEW